MTTNTPSIAHIANLARLSLDNDTEASLTSDVARIVDMFQALQAVNTEGCDPIAHPLPDDLLANASCASRTNSDEASPNDTTALSRDALMANAPHTDAGLFLVPKVIE